MISGINLRDAIISGANNIMNQKQQVDELNVFPVPDGDTGTNMSMTMTSAARELSLLPDDCTAELVAQTAASALLRGARGNSGVILSLLFRGFAKGLKGCEATDGASLSNALSLGVDAAYHAVMKPTEGTILTVARLAATKAKEACASTNDAQEIWNIICSEAEIALAQTPEMLPVLKKAGVVDAGGKGLLVIFEGMKAVFDGREGIKGDSVPAAVSAQPKKIVAKESGDIKFAYCTEFIIDREKDNLRDPLRLRAYLESIGDCVVVVDDEEIIKVHVHTNEPGNAIQSALKYGQLMNIKIDNMRIQHSNANWGASDESPENETAAPSPAAPDKPYGFVAVASGEGIQTLFTDLGVDQIVKGGQTMNPSTEDILAAVLATPAETVFVLPNNKNIIMAAEQVIPLCIDRKVRVLQTRTIPQGLSAMLNFEPDSPAEENHMNMMKAADHVQTAQVTFAARNSSFEGYNIKEGEILGLENGKVSLVDTDPVKAAYRVTRHLFKKGTHQFATIIYGQGITQEQANQVSSMLTAKYDGDIDITIVNGGQPVYYFIVSIE